MVLLLFFFFGGGGGFFSKQWLYNDVIGLVRFMGGRAPSNRNLPSSWEV